MTLSIGTFDGVHIGHQSLIRKMIAHKQATAICNLIVTPWEQTSYEPIYSIEHQNKILTDYGIDYVINQSINSDLQLLSAESLLETIKAKFDFKILFVEKHLELDWKSDKTNLSQMAEKLGVDLEIIAPFTWKGKTITASLIKEALQKRDFASVQEWLGRAYSIYGIYNEGVKLEHLNHPPTGEYDVVVNYTYEKYPSKAFIEKNRIILKNKPPVSTQFPIEIIF